MKNDKDSVGYKATQKLRNLEKFKKDMDRHFDNLNVWREEEGGNMEGSYKSGLSSKEVEELEEEQKKRFENFENKNPFPRIMKLLRG